MWPAESIMQSMRPAMLCWFPSPALAEPEPKVVKILKLKPALYP